MLKEGKSKTEVIFLFLFLVILASFLVNAIGTNDVKIGNPENATWTNASFLSNFTQGFDFEWSVAGNVTMIADCNLFINRTRDNAVDTTGLVFSPNEYGRNASVGNYTNTTILMNRTFDNSSGSERLKIDNNTGYLWTIKCLNLSGTPISWFPTPRILYIDNIVPFADNQTTNIINNTWMTEALRMEVNVTDNRSLFGDVLTCDILNNSKPIASATTIETSNNGTLLNITSAILADGVYSDIDITCTDPAMNVQTVTEFINMNISIDSTDPTATFISPTPGEDSINDTSTLVVNMTITELNIDTLAV